MRFTIADLLMAIATIAVGVWAILVVIDFIALPDLRSQGVALVVLSMIVGLFVGRLKGAMIGAAVALALLFAAMGAVWLVAPS